MTISNKFFTLRIGVLPWLHEQPRGISLGLGVNRGAGLFSPPHRRYFTWVMP